ncbi:GlxA family transcriptional regulator [Candidatus Endowatersipora endosymbiont of Watersipora subatra]|uniref:GlxA family transcriptional regulator n=1 Tax=Candidatus Endowatersipora endosymbiont of Watersipora subatra TaxID=3077946 RepID=UPI00312C8899
MASETNKRHFAFLVIDQFSMFCLAAAIDSLRSANCMARIDYYNWSTISLDGKPVYGSNNILISADYSLDELPECDILFVCAGKNLKIPGHNHLLAKLREHARQGGSLGALSIGSYILAQAGVLNGYECTIHWENRAAFQERFPNVCCTGNVFEIDRNRYTSAGGTTSIDLMLQIIKDDCGEVIANEVANQFQHERIRTDQDRQRVGSERNLIGKSQKLQKAVELMAEYVEEPLSALEIARRVRLSLRQVERLFLRHLSCTPGRYYMSIRLDRSRELLRHTDLSILDVALSTGFTSHSYFAQSYRAHFGFSPSEDRRACHEDISSDHLL